MRALVPRDITSLSSRKETAGLVARKGMLARMRPLVDHEVAFQRSRIVTTKFVALEGALPRFNLFSGLRDVVQG